MKTNTRFIVRPLAAALTVIATAGMLASGAASAAGDTGGNDLSRTNNAQGGSNNTATTGAATAGSGAMNTGASGSANSNTPTGAAQRDPGTSGMAMSGAASASGPGSARDHGFVSKASQAGLAEVEMAKLARDRASSGAVKDFAAHMIDDHQKANDELTRLAGTKGITPSTTLSPKDQSELRKLQGLSGAAFDREYVKSQVAAHKDAVSLFDTEAKRGNDADLKQFAGATLPTLKSHKDKVDDLAKSPAKTASAQ